MFSSFEYTSRFNPEYDMSNKSNFDAHNNDKVTKVINDKIVMRLSEECNKLKKGASRDEIESFLLRNWSDLNYTLDLLKRYEDCLNPREKAQFALLGICVSLAKDEFGIK